MWRRPRNDPRPHHPSRLDLIRDNGYAVSVRSVPERECPTLTYDVTAVADDGERYVVRDGDVHEAVFELAGKVGIDLADG